MNAVYGVEPRMGIGKKAAGGGEKD